jgi:hypothetical protein
LPEDNFSYVRYTYNRFFEFPLRLLSLNHNFFEREHAMIYVRSPNSCYKKGSQINELISGNNVRGLLAEFIDAFTFVFIGIRAVGAAVAAGLSLVKPFVKLD